ncbi:hypothetical protein HU200_022680 [Digitaria exilis]|uniref:Gfo/Idh/MocA-like oxidoreductase N-terminal domain-containing protein n=1 Tax=Digitaria exilis TaxID=1010633 RepID=A0A835EXB4_9POAL|nr:hypothetical protein HU200_022680 [Digitaria exilis]CAB3494054.1 unnamed protein product [Digitaria exilis]
MEDPPPPPEPEHHHRPVRFGILGCAAIARKLARAIRLVPGATIAAVGSRSESKARRFISENGLDGAAVRAHGSYEALLDDPGVDAVYAPLPTGLHARWAAAAAARGKHVLLEKPAAPCAADLDAILAACDAAGVQFMDGTMLMHHPRTHEMRNIIADKKAFGDVRMINSVLSFRVSDDFLQNDIRVKPELDGLGALGDIGWYCVRAILWAVGYELPTTVAALPGSVTKNDAGVVLACGASMRWAGSKVVATFTCSFLASLAMDLTVVGTNGTLRVTDLVIPLEERSAGFSVVATPAMAELAVGWGPPPAEVAVATDLPQEALMVQEFARLVRSVRDDGGRPEGKWPAIARKTQAVLDAVKASIDKGCEPIEIMQGLNN